MPYSLSSFAWSSPESAEALAVRIDVFVHEQNVPAEEEPDELDVTSWHVLVRDDAGRAVATGRLIELSANEGRIGRMAVRREARGTGAGSMVMRALMEEARRRGYAHLVLSAQTHAIPFYERHGFAAYGPEYLDANIPHRSMKRECEREMREAN